ncbi:MAG: ribonuclease HI [Clostridia bacterium]|nr:ribonuclease HI [Clostridia bacterium]
MDKVEIYTDGSCLRNPGPGGWAAILVCRGREKVISGGEPDTTNNRMELLGAISAFEALKKPCDVVFCSDSQYVIMGLSRNWAKRWRMNGWRKPGGKPAQNAELWGRLLDAVEPHTVTYNWIKGHAGHPYNERCDAIARDEASVFIKEEE